MLEASNTAVIDNKSKKTAKSFAFFFMTPQF